MSKFLDTIANFFLCAGFAIVMFIIFWQDDKEKAASKRLEESGNTNI